jgi:RNA polymerase sigma-70 factor (ECF subfamily)
MHETLCGPTGAESPSSIPSDASLITAREGDDADIGQLLESFRPYLAAIAQAEFPSNLAGKLGVSDVVQDTIIKGLERFPQFQGSTREEFARWLRAILRNHLANVLENFSAQKRDIGRERRSQATLVDPWQSSPSGVALSREERERLETALASLPEDARHVILLRHRDDQSFAEIGAALQKSEEAARKIWVRAVATLQQALDRAGP